MCLLCAEGVLRRSASKGCARLVLVCIAYREAHADGGVSLRLSDLDFKAGERETDAQR